MRHLHVVALCLLMALSRPTSVLAQSVPSIAPTATPPITDPPTTEAPVKSPTIAPVDPTDPPTEAPVKSPTLSPVVAPTDPPTEAPVKNPTLSPVDPTDPPTEAPVKNPTLSPVDPTDPPTEAPVNTPTLSPVASTDSPTAAPTAAPSKATPSPTTAAPTTSAPTAAPTAAPSKATPSPTTAAPTTSAPTQSPTSAPTKSPILGTVAPTIQPTSFPTILPTATPTSQPSALPSTASPTAIPSLSPSVAGTKSPTTLPSYAPSLLATEAPTNIPSQSPTSMPTNPPTPTKAPIQPSTPAPTTKVDTTVKGLTITLTGINTVVNTALWSEITTKFYAGQLRKSEDASDIDVKVTFTSQTSGSERRNTRGLQTDSVLVTYEQSLAYSTSDGLTEDSALKLPLKTEQQQDEYVATLKQSDGQAYSGLTSVSTITVPANINPSPAPSPEGGGIPQWAIIVIVVVSVLVLVALFLIVIRRRRSDNSAGEGYTQEVDTYEPSGFGSSSGPQLGDETVETMDYDYAKAYGGMAGDASLSEAGGTMGSRAAPQTGATIFSDDPTFNEAYDGGREEVIDVFAPPGKLGVVIDTPDDNAPVVHAVKDASPIVDQVRVGDKLVAVDDEDVRAMTAIKVSKLISKKSTQETRKLTIIRHVAD